MHEVVGDQRLSRRLDKRTKGRENITVVLEHSQEMVSNEVYVIRFLSTNCHLVPKKYLFQLCGCLYTFWF